MPVIEDGSYAGRTWPSGAVIEGGTVILPAGEYWVGDPCNAVPEHEWGSWLTDAYGGQDGNLVSVLLADVQGKPVLGIGTSRGDGVYYDQLGYEYMVDAGLIGAVPVELWTPTPTRQEPFGMHYFRFMQDVICRNLGGTIDIGHVSIQTNPPAEEEEDYDYDYYPDEYPDPEEDYFPQGEDQ